jgi:cytosine/uracil/thiamine/allantoin permease
MLEPVFDNAFFELYYYHYYSSVNATFVIYGQLCGVGEAATNEAPGFGPKIPIILSLIN